MMRLTDGNKFYSCAIIFTLLLLISSCSDEKVTNDIPVKSESQKKEQELDRKEAKELSEGIKQAQNNNPEGLIRIYKISSITISAENQEVANSLLREQFLKNPDLWIKTFATMDLKNIKKYLRYSGVADLMNDPDLPKDIRSNVINKLKFYSKKKETSGLASHILQINNLK